MNITNSIIVLFDYLENAQIATIYYFGKLQNSNKLFLEYSEIPFSDFPENTNKLEMKKDDNIFHIEYNLENEKNIYFKFVDEFGNEENSENKNGFELNSQRIVEIASTTSTTEYQESLDKSSNIENIYKYQKIENDDQIENEQNLEKQDFEEKNEIENENLALITLEDSSISGVRKGLRWSYKMDKKIRLILYKLFTKLPKFITGNYRRRINL